MNRISQKCVLSTCLEIVKLSTDPDSPHLEVIWSFESFQLQTVEFDIVDQLLTKIIKTLHSEHFSGCKWRNSFRFFRLFWSVTIWFGIASSFQLSSSSCKKSKKKRRSYFTIVEQELVCGNRWQCNEKKRVGSLRTL